MSDFLEMFFFFNPYCFVMIVNTLFGIIVYYPNCISKYFQLYEGCARSCLIYFSDTLLQLINLFVKDKQYNNTHSY